MSTVRELPSHSPPSFSRQLTTAGLVSICIGVAITSGHGSRGATIGGWFIGGGLFAVVGHWMVVFVLAWWRAISAEMKVASTPVPSPGDIAAHLEEEWGRAPTIVEVAAVHQMLTARRNEALIATGVSLGAL